VNKPLLNKALLVGALAAVAIGVFLAAFTFFKKGGYSEADSYTVWATFADATGLTWKSRVQIAGIQVGEVSKIELAGDKARLELRIKKEIVLHDDACFTKAFPSALLPDALLELAPGTSGRPALRDLPAGQREVTCIREAGSTQKLMDALAKVAADVQLVTGDLAKTVNGTNGSLRDIIENVSRLTRRLDDTVAANEGRLASIIENVDVISSDVRDVTQSEREHIKQIVQNLADLSVELRRAAATVQAILGDAGGGAGGAGAAGGTGGALAGGAGGGAAGQGKGVKEAVEKMNVSLARLDALLAKVEEGKGAVGRLISDERMGRQLGNAIEAASNYVERLDKLQIEIQLRSEWALNQSGAKAYFGARLVPRPDKYYIFEIVSDPRGVDTVTTETKQTLDPATGKTSESITTTTTHQQALTYTLQMAKRFGPVAFRGGIIESSGGVGSDLYLFDDTLQLSMSVYQFQRPYTNVFPRAKVWLNYQFLQHFYLTAGADDFLNQWRQGRYPGGPKFTLGTDVFFGAGLFFNDEDVKTLLGAGAGSVVSSMSTTK